MHLSTLFAIASQISAVVQTAGPPAHHLAWIRGGISLLGHPFAADPAWPNRLVRAEVDLTNHVIRIYALRRREPTWQPLLQEIPYDFAVRRFRP